jgi:hypothetical protein
VTVVFHFPLPCNTLCPVVAYHVVEVYPCVFSSDARNLPVPASHPLPRVLSLLAVPTDPIPRSAMAGQHIHHFISLHSVVTLLRSTNAPTCAASFSFSPLHNGLSRRFLNGRGDLCQQTEADQIRCYGSRRNLPSYVSCRFAISHVSLVP